MQAHKPGLPRGNIPLFTYGHLTASSQRATWPSAQARFYPPQYTCQYHGDAWGCPQARVMTSAVGHSQGQQVYSPRGGAHKSQLMRPTWDPTTTKSSHTMWSNFPPSLGTNPHVWPGLARPGLGCWVPADKFLAAQCLKGCKKSPKSFFWLFGTPLHARWCPLSIALLFSLIGQTH